MGGWLGGYVYVTLRSVRGVSFVGGSIGGGKRRRCKTYEGSVVFIVIVDCCRVQFSGIERQFLS